MGGYHGVQPLCGRSININSILGPLWEKVDLSSLWSGWEVLEVGYFSCPRAETGSVHEDGTVRSLCILQKWQGSYGLLRLE